MSAVQQPVIPTPIRKLRLPRQRPAVYYPDSDGKPMAENDIQYQSIVDTQFALAEWYREEEDIYVGADLLIYYVEGDPTKSVAPDVFVSLGVPKGHRFTYLIWEEGKPPDVVFEIASPGTWRADTTTKHRLYERLGIEEYFLFDPQGKFLHPALQGYRLVEGTYAPVPVLLGERGKMGLESEVLGLELWAKVTEDAEAPYVLRLYDPVSETWLPTPAWSEAERRAEAAARRVAEERAKREAEARRAEAKARRVAEERAEREAEARRAAEAQLRAMEAELARLQKKQR